MFHWESSTVMGPSRMFLTPRKDKGQQTSTMLLRPQKKNILTSFPGLTYPYSPEWLDETFSDCTPPRTFEQTTCHKPSSFHRCLLLLLHLPFPCYIWVSKHSFDPVSDRHFIHPVKVITFQKGLHLARRQTYIVPGKTGYHVYLQEQRSLLHWQGQWYDGMSAVGGVE